MATRPGGRRERRWGRIRAAARGDPERRRRARGIGRAATRPEVCGGHRLATGSPVPLLEERRQKLGRPPRVLPRPSFGPFGIARVDQFRDLAIALDTFVARHHQPVADQVDLKLLEMPEELGIAADPDERAVEVIPAAHEFELRVRLRRVDQFVQCGLEFLACARILDMLGRLAGGEADDDLGHGEDVHSIFTGQLADLRALVGGWSR